ncbi:putative FBD domain-containing protein [Medicago truncatula]|nr:uncharacterized protein LOC11427750 [Medicago truncatula]RHN55341.1 putative FBD domain-containing protein [Medicago truncatula]
MTSDTFQSLYFSADTLHLLPLFHSLTHLYITHSWIMDFTLEVLFDILHKTPKLEVLGIPMVYCLHLVDEEVTINSVPCCFKSSLKFLWISDFNGYKYEVQMISLLVEKFTILEEMKISFSGFLSDCLEEETAVKNQLQSLCHGKFAIEFK